MGELKNIRFFLSIFYLLVLFGGCAKMGSMSGGIKDELPPKLLSSKPLNYSVNFNSQKIEMVFDEYIVLKNVNQELIISPPLPKKPDVRVKNKSIVIDLKNELRVNTTYTLNFGKAIADNNEGNPLTNFEFVFSTGDFLDSLSVKGTLLNAFNLQASKEPFIIGLYDQTEDSVPMKTIPVYIGKTNEKGLFQINNIKSDTFKLFALKDLNYNLIFDLPNEEIAFIDTLLIITPEFLSSLPVIISESDTINPDTVQVIRTKEVQKSKRKSGIKNKKTESQIISSEEPIVIDSLDRKPVLPALFVDMFSFLQEGTKQYMTNKERLKKESFQVSFSLPLEEDPAINVLDYEETENWYLPEINSKRDTFTYWITDTTLINSDTLKLEIAYPMVDSTGAIYIFPDTIKFISRKSTEKPGRGKAEEKKPVEKLILTSVRNNGLLDFNSNLPINFNYPLKKIDTTFLHLYAKLDTTEILQNFEIVNDSISSRKVYLRSDWKEKVKYRVQVLPGAFIDLYDHTNDTLQFRFGIQEKSFYGTLTVTQTEITTPVVIELMNEKEQVLRTKIADGDGALIFDFLPPAKYKLKFVYDTNGNKKWDTGNYLKGIQPEMVMYYEGEINIRSNWELEVKQSLQQ